MRRMGQDYGRVQVVGEYDEDEGASYAGNIYIAPDATTEIKQKMG